MTKPQDDWLTETVKALAEVITGVREETQNDYALAGPSEGAGS